MYCPRCGQQFMSDARFCSRCGMSVNIIAAITSSDGRTTADGKIKFSKRPPRQKGMRVGAMLMLGSLALSPLFFGMCVAIREASPLLFPLTTFLIGLSWLLYSYVFADEGIPIAKQHEAYFLPRDTSSSLNRFKAHRRGVAAPAEPPSAVDHTTHFFD